MIKGKIVFILFVLLFVILCFLKYEKYFFEKFSEISIKVVSPRVNSNIDELLYTEKNNNESTSKINEKKVNKLNLVKNTSLPDYKNDTILLSCFDEKKLKTFDKYEPYTTKLYFRRNGDVAGEVWITPSHIVENLPQITLNGYFLNNLCVKKEYRRQGIARSLLNKVINKAKKENKLHVILHVNSGKNPHLVDFYESVGFSTYLTNIDKDGYENKLMFNKL